MKKTYGIMVMILALGLVSCGPYRPKTNEKPMQETEKIVLLDHGLTYYLKIVKQKASKLPGGQLEVKVELENGLDKDVWVDIQTIFRGEDGFELEKTDWEPLLIHRRAVTLIKRNSLNPAATDYRILIRDVKKS